jgi:hypothetical protein
MSGIPNKTMANLSKPNPKVQPGCEPLPEPTIISYSY